MVRSRGLGAEFKIGYVPLVMSEDRFFARITDLAKLVIEAFRDVCRVHGLPDWSALGAGLVAKSRLHIETY